MHVVAAHAAAVVSSTEALASAAGICLNLLMPVAHVLAASWRESGGLYAGAARPSMRLAGRAL